MLNALASEITIHHFSRATLYFGLGTGLLVLFLGDWRKLTLKFTGVAFSVASVFYMLLLQKFHPNIYDCTLDHISCDSRSIFGIIRNIAFIFFHVTCGMDAIRIKGKDRRTS